MTRARGLLLASKETSRMGLTRSGYVVASAIAALALTGCADSSGDPVIAHLESWGQFRARNRKIDLLFMIDNSSSMADKQAILALAVPDLVGRLVNPVCIDPVTFSASRRCATPNGSCATGEPDFEPVKDIHIGIISSSLGGHGSTGVCDQPDTRKTFPHNDDKGHLLTRGAMDVRGRDPRQQAVPQLEPHAGRDTPMPRRSPTPFASMVAGVGQHGCGYEASLESIYRFLIEPDPYDSITIDKAGGGLGVAVLNGTDTALLAAAQRLPAPRLAGLGHHGDRRERLLDHRWRSELLRHRSSQRIAGRRASSRTAPRPAKTNPNDACCFSCLQHNHGRRPAPRRVHGPGRRSRVRARPVAQDRGPREPPLLQPEEALRNRLPLSGQALHRRVHQHASSSIATGNAGQEPALRRPAVRNEMGCAAERDKTFVFLAGIVGVPWQDIAVDPIDLTKGYKTAKEISDEGTLAEDPREPEPSDKTAPVPPTDLAHDRVGDPARRPARHRQRGQRRPHPRPRVGHVQGQPANRDLQYACTFPLPMGSEDLHGLDRLRLRQSRPTAWWPT